MGDRCYLAITICGHIETIEAFKEIVTAIQNEFWSGGVVDQLRIADETGDDPEFSADEVNYGKIDDLEEVLKSHKVDYQVSHGEGGEYPGGNRAYCSADGSYEESVSCHGDTVLSDSSLTAALETDDPIKTIKALLEAASKSCGVGLPSFSLSHEVRGWLAIGGPSLEPKKETA